MGDVQESGVPVPTNALLAAAMKGDDAAVEAALAAGESIEVAGAVSVPHRTNAFPWSLYT